MVSHRPSRAKSPIRASLSRRRRALSTHLPVALTGDSHAVHQARVASRRMRETLPVAGADLDRHDVKKARKHMRTLTRVLGPVRELDVALKMTAARREAHPGERRALQLVEAALTRDLDRARARLTKTLDEEKIAHWLERIAALEEQLEPDNERGKGHDDDRSHGERGKHDRSKDERGERGARSKKATAQAAWRTVLTERLEKRAERLRKSMEQAGVLFVAERLHCVRIALKRLRYALELAGELRLASTTAAVRDLKAVQDTLGALHDTDVLMTYVECATTEAGVDRGTHAALESLHAVLEKERRTLHAQFLSRQPTLLRLHDRALEVAAKLHAQPQPARAPRRSSSGRAKVAVAASR
jgi:CHAD domain-containing protein